MIGIYLLSALIIATLLYLIDSIAVKHILISFFVVIQAAYALYAYTHMNIAELEYFTPDALGVLFLSVVSIITIPALIHSRIYFIYHPYLPREQGMYYAAMVILIAALSAAYLANHIAVTWVFVELTTLSASALIYHRRNNLTLEGTWKYIFVCSISITLVFIGILFLSIAIQEEGLKDLSYTALLQQAPHLNVFWLKLAFLFIFTGFTSKVGLVPMYTAGIDAKDKSPHPAGALLSSVLMNMGFIGIFRFYEIISHTSIHAWSNNIMFISAGASVFVATVYMLKVKNFKRLMAYSSVEHMGLVFLGLAAGGIGAYAAILHLVLHSFAKSSLFLQFGQMNRTFNSKNIYDMGDYFRLNPSGAILLLLSFITVTAMPPSGMFISEFLLFRSLFEAHLIWLMVAVLILLTFIIWSFGRNVFKILFIKPVSFDESKFKRIPPAESLSQYLLLAVVLWFGYYPPAQLIDLIQTAIINLPQLP
ncbi:MAG TPA: hypothetical protein DCR43_09305 [Bacteroidales bacterium]|nr:MAG: hypothetical protein A2X11_03320 [Bacteroidetes bacterium GWE2_42_24]OFY32746.1 MAG: hypothetical protein A2X09_06805 [Bacteroidetes bacterium GWF2_43_11]HAQ66030.1 hypothetical protein [Bacteroidales bacterium]HBZ65272.1 hypothetical protein [Bacteroidales bacterium]